MVDLGFHKVERHVMVTRSNIVEPIRSGGRITGLHKVQLEVREHDCILETIYQILELSPVMWWIILLSSVLSLLFYRLEQFKFKSDCIMILRNSES